MTVRTILRESYYFLFETLAKIKNYRCFYSKKNLKFEYKNLFYSKDLDIYEFRPQPPMWLWKLMHRKTVLSAYTNEEVLKKREKVSNDTLDLIEKYVKKGILFDIGANGGAFLNTAKKRGWKIEGNELSLDAIKLAKKNFGINLKFGYFTKLDLKKNFYDAIVMWNVLEHTHNPFKELKKAYEVLKSGGIVAILVPTKTKKELRSEYEAFHLFEFQKLGLEKMVEKAGFEKLYSQEGMGNKHHFTKVIYQKPKK